MLESSEHGQRNTESKSSGGGGEDRARSKLQQETQRLLHTTHGVKTSVSNMLQTGLCQPNLPNSFTSRISSLD